MRVFLMFRDRDFVPQERFSPLVEELVEDLELEVLFTAMALGDDYLHRVARATLLSSLHDIDTILYRQAILKDCLNNASIIKAMYALVVKAIESKKGHTLGASSPAIHLQSFQVLWNSCRFLWRCSGN